MVCHTSGTGSGTITAGGLFTASTAGTVTVRATSVAPAVFGTAAVTVTVVPPPAPAPDDDCTIATATFGTPMAEEVEVLSRFRDEYLLTNELGRRFVSLYCQHSPAIAEYISNREWAKRVVRIALSPLVRIAELIVGGEEGCR
jgi:hypothetical protein